MARAKPSQTARSPSARAQATKIPDNIFRDLTKDVSDTQASSPVERPLKRRKVVGQTDGPATASTDINAGHSQHQHVAATVDFSAFGPTEDQSLLDRLDGKFSSTDASDDESVEEKGPEQVIDNDTESSAEEDDIDWTNLLTPEGMKGADTAGAAGNDEAHDRIQLDLNKESNLQTKRSASQRLPSTLVEKRRRLDIHKIHVCTLLSHVYVRNAWCNDHRVQDILSRSLDNRTRGFLSPKSSLSQRDRTTQLIKGLEQASHIWRGNFVISARGMRKPQWPADERQLKLIEQVAKGTEFDRADFLRASARPSGSRDVGAQLFCALLRSAGVDARLVCSLQPLSFTSIAPTITHPTQKPTVDLSANSVDYDTDASATSARSSSPAPRPVRRFGQKAQGASDHIDTGKAPATPKTSRVRDSAYPVFWVEAFNSAKQQWVPVDPFATQTVNRPAKLEPPASDMLTSLTYVIAMDEDGTAKDVTRRYAKAYNAKTRRHRVEATQHGERWFRHAMKLFRPYTAQSDRDKIEDGELNGYEAKEPMPRNVQDFKNHPYYALERHLKRHEVIHPRREAGKLRTGNGENVEPVFRKRDVKLCQTADKWYRGGRELREGEQPLKRVPARRKPRPELDMDDEDGEEEDDGTIGLFARDQTELYKPPACVHGRVPKNLYKDLDVYVPSMIPPGAVHIRSSDAVPAARILRLDFAEAVTGFQFKGRKGTAVVNGIIVAKEYREAMEEVVDTLRWQRLEMDRLKRSRIALGTWKRFLVGMRIRERIMTGQDESAEGKDINKVVSEDDGSGSEYAPEDTEGGFVSAEGPTAYPTRGTDRDVIAEKFQDGIAESINDDIAKGSKEYWEPTVTSPWDVPGLLESIPSPAATLDAPQTDEHIEGLFEDLPEQGGFVREDAVEVKAENAEQEINSAGGGFLVEQDNTSDDVVHSSRLASQQELNHSVSSGGPVPVQVVAQEEATLTVDYHPDTRTETDNVSNAGQASGSDSLDDQSLLSHDPNDSDAEPEWLDDEVEL